MTTERKPTTWGRGLKVAAVVAFAAWLAYEWVVWPNGSPLLGPLGFVRYAGADACSVAVVLFLLPLVLAFVWRPCHLTALLSLLGLLLWTLLGAAANSC
jgi:hypothetical protein